MVLLSSLILSKIYHIYRLEYASIPDVGSSKNIIFEFPTKLIPRESFLLDPPESVLTN